MRGLLPLKWIAGVSVLAATIVLPRAAHAWKPYTHVFTADQSFADATDDGKVHIRNKDYPIDANLLAALNAGHKPFFNGGVIGPDGFPDLTYGQAVIHPKRTGAWLRHLLINARAQVNGSGISAEEKLQIMAYTYGFMTHAAGDMWGHTYINDFAQGVFPSVTEFGELGRIEIAARHLIAEAYVGDATPGYDGNRTETKDLPGGDRSDDATPGIPFAVPVNFVYTTLVDPNCVGCSADSPHTPFTPAVDGNFASRGPLIGFFLDMRAKLASFGGLSGGVLADAAKHWQDARNDLNRLEHDCIDDPSLDCFADLVDLGIDGISAGVEFLAGQVLKAVDAILFAYLRAWIDDIDDGLRHWPEFGLASTQALFDPQTRRNVQNNDFMCRLIPAGTHDRDVCEHGIGLLDTLMENSDDFINDHLLSMLGLPDFVGEFREALDTIVSALQDIVVALELPFNPLIGAVLDVQRAIHEFFHGIIEGFIDDVFNINIVEIESFVGDPGPWFLVDDTGPALGAAFGFPGQSLHLFNTGDHERMDAFLFLPDNHHIPTGFTFPGFPNNAPTRLTDDAEMDTARFKAVANTIMMSKLLLLEGSQLDTMLGDTLVDLGYIQDASLIATYPKDGGSLTSNVMFTPLLAPSDDPKTVEPFLQLIDGDHAWRGNGLPRFCTDNSTCQMLPDGRTPQLRDTRDPNGGNGHFPIWSSCVLRPAFRELFQDWEDESLPTDQNNFPEFKDPPLKDDRSDPSPPTIADPSISGSFIGPGGTIFVGGNSVVSLSATDNLFVQSKVNLRVRATKAGDTPGDFTLISNPGTFSISTTSDAKFSLEVEAEDPCHTFATTDDLTQGSKTVSVVVDTTPPAIRVDAPLPFEEFLTNETLTLNFSADDGPIGSGVASLTATLDGVPVSNGQVIDFYTFTPGQHTLVVTAKDNVGNTATVTRIFGVHVDQQSLRDNLDRAFIEGKITDLAFEKALRQDLTAAIDAANRGLTDNVAADLASVMKRLWAKWDTQCRIASRCTGIDRATLQLFIVRAADAIATLRVPALALGAGNDTTKLFETLNKGFLAGKAARGYDALRAALSPAVFQTYTKDFAGARKTLSNFADVVTDQLGYPCKDGPDTCLLDRAFGLSLLRQASELVATLGLSPDIKAGSKAFPLLSEAGNALEAGQIKDVATYVRLRSGLTAAILAETGWASTNDPVKGFKDGMASVRAVLIDLFKTKCVDGAFCKSITLAVANSLMTESTLLQAEFGLDPALVATLRSVPVLNDLLTGFTNGDLPNIDLFADLSGDLIAAVEEEASPRKDQVTALKATMQDFLDDLAEKIRGGCATTLLLKPKCFDIDRAFADELLVEGSEVLALAGVKPAQEATLKTIEVLRLLNQKYLAGSIPDFGSYEKLRGDALNAIFAEVSGNKNGAKTALAQFVTDDNNIIKQGKKFIDAAAGQALVTDAKQVSTGLG